MNSTNGTTNIRMAWVDSPAEDPPCLINTDYLPSKHCKLKNNTFSGVDLRFTLMVLKYLLRPEFRRFRLELVRGDGFSPNEWANDSSITSLVSRGDADISPAYMGRSEKRFRLVAYSPQLSGFALALIYKKPPKKIVVMDIALLFPDFVVVGIIYGSALASTFYGTRFVMREMFESKIEGNVLLLCYGLFGGGFLEIINGYVTGLFNKPLPPATPFFKDKDIIARLDSGEYRALFMSDIYLNAFKGVMKKYLQPGIKLKPGAKKYGAQFLELEAAGAGPLVWIASEPYAADFVRDFCELGVYLDRSFSLTASHLQIHPLLLEDHFVRMTSAHGQVAAEDRRRLVLSEAAPSRHCGDEAADEPPEQLLFVQIRSCILVLLSFLGFDVLVLAGEIVFGRFCQPLTKTLGPLLKSFGLFIVCWSDDSEMRNAGVKGEWSFA